MAYFRQSDAPAEEYRPAFDPARERWNGDAPEEDVQYYIPDEGAEEEQLPQTDWEEQSREAGRIRRLARIRMLFGLSDFFAVILGTVVILVLAALLISLVNWLNFDLNHTFTFLMRRR